MITTASEVIARLGIDDSQISRIEAILSGLEEQFMIECKNRFLNPLVRYSSSSIVFDGKTITDEYADFEEENFIAGWVYVVGSVHNDGWHEISEISGNELTMVNDLTTEDSGEFITLQLAKFTNDLKNVIADMVGEELGKETKGIRSESLGSHSISYFDSYSPLLQKRISAYKRLYW